jgi:hypothetical protein
MRKARPACSIASVPSDSRPPEPLVVVLNLDLTEEPVGGNLALGQHANRPFSGWYELVGFLEDAVREARQTRSTRRTDRNPPQTQPSDGREGTELKAT